MNTATIRTLLMLSLAAFSAVISYQVQAAASQAAVLVQYESIQLESQQIRGKVEESRPVSESKCFY